MNQIKIQKSIIIIPLILLAITMGGCRLVGVQAKYSTTGASISPDIKTAAVLHFQNRASLVQPLLAQKLTEKLKDKILSQTSLKISGNSSGDVVFDGSITSYTTEPKGAAQTGQIVSTPINRLTVTIKVKYTNTKDSKQDFDEQFSRYIDYSSDKNLESVEASELDGIVDNLVQDIFNKAFVNW
ncbi:MAG: LptE family protein [Bacteroidota bacterium]|nr:LptE family protein [Bacteroidota bacterium]